MRMTNAAVPPLRASLQFAKHDIFSIVHTNSPTS